MGGFRRAAVALASTALVAPWTAGLAAEASAGGRQVAGAIWIGRGRNPEVFVVSAVRFTTPQQGVQARALIARGRCSGAARGGRLGRCILAGRIYEVAPQHFDFDPLLGSASVRVKADGYVHFVSWEGRGSIREPALTRRAGSGVVAVGAEAKRSADARGRLFGRKLESGTFDRAWLSEGGDAAVGYGSGDGDPPPVRVRRDSA